MRITANAPVNNSWADLDVDLINEQNQEVESVNIPIEYYTGVDRRRKLVGRRANAGRDAFISACRKIYSARRRNVAKFPAASAGQRQSRAKRHARRKFLSCALFCSPFAPVLRLIRKFSFESKRWSESMFGNGSEIVNWLVQFTIILIQQTNQL